MPLATERYEASGRSPHSLRASAAGRPGGSYRVLPTRAGGSPPYGCYLQDQARGVLVLTPNPDDSKIVGTPRFLNDTLHRYFGLPDTQP